MNSPGAFAADTEPPYNPPLSLNGTASLMWRAGDDERVIRLTDGGYRQAGSAWSTQPVDLTESFETRFTAHLRSGKTGADGIAFVAQGQGPRALGGWGGGLGYRGIRNSVAVEFDIYQNQPDPSGNHLAVSFSGNPDRHSSAAESSIPLYGKPFQVRVRYDADNWRLQVHVRALTPGATEELMLDQEVSLSDRIGTTSGWIGFTGSTGHLTARQDIYEWTVATPQE
ncbi:L-type lectin-domain containing protein [Actinoplanes sp. NPDC023801]|uniref:L-type lectin-domain containing protein n=1 Tax=Actinoplanes sp. NPDC023801 TaxID=3154595 RepID=UPI0033C9B8AD